MPGSTFSAMDISASGLAAERLRMEIIANNIANAGTTQTPEGGPYRRQQVVFATLVDNLRANTGGGVRVAGVTADPAELPQVYQPGHPHADALGMLRLPNVKLPNEMVDLITASRSYEANLRAIRTFREMAEQTLAVLRGVGG